MKRDRENIEAIEEDKGKTQGKYEKKEGHPFHVSFSLSVFFLLPILAGTSKWKYLYKEKESKHASDVLEGETQQL